MALNNFIPTLWGARLLENLNKALRFAQAGVVNRDYEGTIQALGDSVKINSIGRVTVGDYAKNTNIGDPETLSDGQTTLTITQSKYFNFQIDDVDRAQQAPKVMDAAMRESAYAINNTIDQFVAGFYTDAATTNLIGTDASPKTVGLGGSDAQAYNLIVDAKTALDVANVPDDGQRWIIVPPWIEGLLLKDERFVKFGTPAQDERLLNGQIRQVSGFNVMTSNNVNNTADTKHKLMFGHPMAISFALQINNVEAYRPEKRFADAVKGLTLYGGKVVRPDALGVITASKGTL
jgi:N4-gp56 family major capsid protein